MDREYRHKLSTRLGEAGEFPGRNSHPSVSRGTSSTDLLPPLLQTIHEDRHPRVPLVRRGPAEPHAVTQCPIQLFQGNRVLRAIYRSRRECVLRVGEPQSQPFSGRNGVLSNMVPESRCRNRRNSSEPSPRSCRSSPCCRSTGARRRPSCFPSLGCPESSKMPIAWRSAWSRTTICWSRSRNFSWFSTRRCQGTLAACAGATPAKTAIGPCTFSRQVAQLPADASRPSGPAARNVQNSQRKTGPQTWQS